MNYNIDEKKKDYLENMADFIIDEIDQCNEIHEDGENLDYFFDFTNKNDLEDIDETLLFNVLDHIAYSEDMEHVELPSEKIKYKLTKERSHNIIQTVRKQIHHKFWINPSDDLTRRLPICLDCESHECFHIDQSEYGDGENILEIAMDICNHRGEDDILDICIKCVREAAKKISENTNDNLLLLWDTIDLSNYYKMVNEINMEYGMSN